MVTKGLPERETLENAALEGPDLEEAREYLGESTPGRGDSQGRGRLKEQQYHVAGTEGAKERGAGATVSTLEWGQMVSTCTQRCDITAGQ